MKRRNALGVLVLMSALAGCAAGPVTGPSAAPELAAPAITATQPAPVSAPQVLTSEAPSVASVLPSAEGNVTVPLPQCRAETLVTTQSKVLTFAAPPQVDAPWFGSTAATGQGLNGALALELGAALGYGPTQIRWVTVPEGETTARVAEFDAAINTWPAPDRPVAGLDHTSGYLDNAPTLVTLPDSRWAGATSLAALDGAVLGVVTALPVTESTAGERRYSTTAAALAALRAGQIDGAVVDLVSAAAADDLTSVGIVPTDDGWQSRQLSLALAADSPLTPCLSTAIDLLRVNGTLDRIADRWIGLPRLS